MRVTKMAAPLGAIVEDLDVRKVGEDEAATLNQLFGEHHVLVFPKQELTPDEQIAFAQHWGELVPFPYGSLPGYPNIIELRNRGKKRDVNQHWHSDMTYDPRPPKLTMLYALEAPAIGGETAFANQIHAYEELSTGMKSLVDSWWPSTLPRIWHACMVKTQIKPPKQSTLSYAPMMKPVSVRCTCAKAFTRRFRDWSRQESKVLLDYLYEHCVRPEFQARHQWQAGDLVMWDNRCLLHYAVHDHGDDPRLIHRLQVRGSAPV